MVTEPGDSPRILVTGASRGIGRAVCHRLASEGPVRIAACGNSHPDELQGTVDTVRDIGGEAVALRGDLSDPRTSERLVDGALEALGGLDGLVANAGFGWPGTLLDTDLDRWDDLFAVNLRAVWLLATAAHPALKASGGSIVTVASLSGVAPHPGMGAYSVAKAGVVMLTRLMAQEWATDGIRANCVSPGFIRTPLTEAAYKDEDFKARREAWVPLGQVGDPARDVAGVVTFLLSSAAAYCTGQNIVADGGVLDAGLGAAPRRPA